jgi:hypothetical protein
LELHFKVIIFEEKFFHTKDTFFQVGLSLKTKSLKETKNKKVKNPKDPNPKKTLIK